jgi:hypothetical protein
MHVEQVLGDVPVAQRCRCKEERAAAPAASEGGKRGWWPFGK